MNSAKEDSEETPLHNEHLHHPDKADDVQQSTETLQVPKSIQDFEDCTWEQLEEKYANAMNEHSLAEESLKSQTAQLLQVFGAWSQATVLHDESRALKRFKTQMQHVQNSEQKVETKRKNYVEVVRAFENALSLLNDRMKL